jgi:hypothetical protein
LGGTKLKLDDPQVEHLRRAQELVAKAYAEVLAANISLLFGVASHHEHSIVDSGPVEDFDKTSLEE